MSLLGGAKEKKTASGWTNFDPVGTIAGWVVNRTAFELRHDVEVIIDGEHVATVTSNRYHRTLHEQGTGDGLYAFVVAIPPHFWDGEEHSFEVLISETRQPLKVKDNRFAIGGPVNKLEFDRITFSKLYLRYMGRAGRDPALDLIVGGDRIGQLKLDTTYSGDPSTVSATIDAELCEHIKSGQLRVSLPGAAEIGMPGVEIPVPEDTLHAWLAVDGMFYLELENQPIPAVAAAIALLDEAGETLHVEEVPNFVGQLALPVYGEALNARQASLTFPGIGWEPLTAQIRRQTLPAVFNSNFDEWDGDSPTYWEVGEAPHYPGFFAFSRGLSEQSGLTGHSVQFEAPEAPEGGLVLLTQTVSRKEVDHGVLSGAIAFRASTPVELEVRLKSGEGAGSASVASRSPWDWTVNSFELETPRFTGEEATVELALVSGGPATVEVAGLILGADSFESRLGSGLAEIARTSDDINIVRNAALNEWSTGISKTEVGGRVELADSWYGYARKARRFSAFAITDPAFKSTALAVISLEAEGYFALEVPIEINNWMALSTSKLVAMIGSPPSVRRHTALARANAPEYQVVNRALLIKRSTTTGEQGVTVKDTTVATLGKNIVVHRAVQEVSFPIFMDEERLTENIYAQKQENVEEEHYLVLMFEKTVALAISEPRLVSMNEGAAGYAKGPVALEDDAIASQLSVTKGIAHWGSKELGRPRGPAAERGEATLKWSWQGATPSVEVLVCVYGAIDETLACLRSLETTTTIPHTVRIVDDGASPTDTQLLADYVATKPNYILTVNPETRGYTFSADRGMRESAAEWVVLLNSDTIATNYWLEGLLECAMSRPNIALAGPLSNAASYQSIPELYDAKLKWRINELPPGRSPQDVADFLRKTSQRDFPSVPLLNGFCTLIKRDVFLEVGGLNSIAFPEGYGEETDMCLRMLSAGYEFAVADHVYVYHLKSASFGSARRTVLSKAGNQALKKLHPDAQIQELTERFRNTPSLVRIRDEARKWYDQAI